MDSAVRTTQRVRLPFIRPLSLAKGATTPTSAATTLWSRRPSSDSKPIKVAAVTLPTPPGRGGRRG